jgi:hypothetical protein
MSHGPRQDFTCQSALAQTLTRAIGSILRSRHLRLRLLRILSFVPIVAATLAKQEVLAVESASATITDQPLGGGVFQYNLALKDTGTTNIGTLWFSWVPGEDFMTTSPTNVLTPANWIEIIMHGGSNDGYSIQFVNGSGPLTPGNTLGGFQFDSTMTPAQMAGKSIFFPTTQVPTSYVYSGGPFSDAGFQFIASVQTPEPSSIILASIGGTAVLLVVWRRRRRSAIAV